MWITCRELVVDATVGPWTSPPSPSGRPALTASPPIPHRPLRHWPSGAACVERLADLAQEHVGSERLLEERDTFCEHAVAHDRVIGVARRRREPSSPDDAAQAPRRAFGHRSSGALTTSVRRRWISFRETGGDRPARRSRSMPSRPRGIARPPGGSPTPPRASPGPCVLNDQDRLRAQAHFASRGRMARGVSGALSVLGK